MWIIHKSQAQVWCEIALKAEFPHLCLSDLFGKYDPSQVSFIYLPNTTNHNLPQGALQSVRHMTPSILRPIQTFSGDNLSTNRQMSGNRLSYHFPGRCNKNNNICNLTHFSANSHENTRVTQTSLQRQLSNSSSLPSFDWYIHVLQQKVLNQLIHCLSAESL